ncbi:lipopolysaccharide biosynthesis protein [Nafulsella turpanensis]|uniref:lipopolysaccharide biosynthesis protein n=1 Tax=Nafulsella turpanensis TaxID=1265690 RepID=UPI00034D9A9C|nr:oligosaccharide flippase family protein [Nafulsella turpanensis]
MGIVVKQTIRSSFITYLGALIGYVNVIWLFPRFLEPDQIGLLRALQDLALLLAPFAALGLNAGIIRYAPQFKDRQLHAFITFTFLSSLLSIGLFSLIFYIFQKELLSPFLENAPLVAEYGEVAMVLVVVMVLTYLLEAFSRSQLNIVLPNFVREICIRAFTTVSILLFIWYWRDLEMLIYSLIGVYGLSFFILTFSLFSGSGLRINTDFKFLEKPFIKEFARYAFYTFLGSSGVMIVQKVDSLMVTSLLGAYENGIYTTAFFIAVIIEMPNRAILQITVPLLSRAFEKQDLKEVNTLYTEAAINQLLIGLLLFTGIVINLPNLFALMPKGDEFANGTWVVILIGLGKLMDILAGVNGEIIVLSRYYRFNLIAVGILALLTILFNFLLIPEFGLTGAAFASMAAIIFYNIVKYIFVYRKFNIQPFTFRTLKALIVGGIILAVGLLLPRMESAWLDLVLRSAVVSVLYLGLVYWLKLSKEATDLIRTGLKYIGL